MLLARGKREVVCIALVWAFAFAFTAEGQRKIELTNEVGAKGPCLGLGIGMALVGKCVSRAEAEGFVKVDEVGVDGLTIGTAGADDGIITAVAPSSAGEASGLQKGDRILSVDDKPAHWTPAMEVQRQSFGEKDQKITMTLQGSGGGAPREVNFQRGAAPMPKDAPSGSMLVPLMPLIDWRGRFVPCTAGGPMTPAVNAICAKEYAKYGYIRAKDLGQTGVLLDSSQTDKAVIATVDPQSEAAKAGVRPGDVILAIDGKPLSGSAGELAKMMLFGKQGASKAVVVDRGGKQVTSHLALRPASGG